MNEQTAKIQEPLECEKPWIFAMLMCVAGFFGAYTYTTRGGVFCNAQTANFVVFGMHLGKGEFSSALYYLIPMSAYFSGTVVSEMIAKPIKRLKLIRWDTLLILIEICAVIMLGFIPDSAPFQISQVTINFICSMQYNTFRKTSDVPMATTFCTNHLRQVGVHFSKAVIHRDKSYLKRMFLHLVMILMFTVGASVSSLCCSMLGGRAIWFALVPLTVLLTALLRADLKTEKGELERIPSGH